MQEIISGMTADVVISIFGEDLDMLDRKAREIVNLVAIVPGATDVQIPSPPGTPQIVIRLQTVVCTGHGGGAYCRRVPAMGDV